MATADIHAIVEILRESASSLPRPEYPWEERPRFAQPLSHREIDRYERAIGFSLPDDVREFLGQVSEIVAMSIHNGYWLGGTTKLQGLLAEGAIPRIVNNRRVAPIATDGGGNVFLLSESGQVLRWLHDSGETREVSPTFTDFLRRVSEDWRAYLSNNQDWSFIVT